MGTYKDTFIWKMVESQYADVAEVIDNFKEVSCTSTGITCRVDKHKYITIKLDIVSGLQAEVSEYSSKRTIDINDIVQYIERINEEIRLEQYRRSEQDRVRKILSSVGLHSSPVRLTGTDLYLAAPVSDDTLRVCIGYYDSEYGFTCSEDCTRTLSDVKTEQDCKDMCREVINIVLSALTDSLQVY